MEKSLQSTRVTAYPRRAVLRGAGRVAAGVAVGALAGSRAFAPTRARAASATTVLFTSFGFTCEAPVFVAQAQGYFKDEGLDLTLAGAANPTEAFTRLTKGTADAAPLSAWSLVPQWLPTGVQLGDVVATAGLERGCNSLLVAKDSPYHSLVDLKGQKVAAAPSTRFLYGEPMALAGLNPLKDINWQPALPAPAIAAALANQDVAASAASEPLPATLLAAGAARALVVQDMPPMLMDYCCSVLVAGALLRADRSKAAAITRALLRGSAWAAAHPSETAQLEVAGKNVQATLAVNQSAIATIAFAPSVSAAQANTREMLARMVKLGFLDPTTDVPGLLNQIFVPVTADLPASAQGLPQSGGAPLALPLGGGLALLGLGLLARRAGRGARDEPEHADPAV
jgi:NitT/TauT family transport system substrate-binding protein